MAAREESQKEVETVMVAVGVILLVAGAKHGLANLVEQWRALVFLLLNLLLLTIAFTSIRSNKTETQTKSISKQKEEKETVKTNKSNATVAAATNWPMQVEDFFDAVEEMVMVAPEHEKDAGDIEADVGFADEDEVEVDEALQVSKEELNARVESFILMFRQQLALDAKEKSRHSFSPVVSKGTPVTVR